MGTAAAEAKYYPVVDIPIPSTVPMRPGASRFSRMADSPSARAAETSIS